MRLDRNSYGTVFGVLGACVALVALALIFIPSVWVALAVSFVLIWFAIFVVCFFRVPRRKAAGSDKAVTSVADGLAIIIDEAYEPEFLKTTCKRVCIYMNFFDMHANFWPVTGQVTYYKYHPGKHLLVFKPKASEDNEHTCTCIRTADGKDVFFKQIAGGFARRIVNYAEVGMPVKAGDQCGIIKFGSRVDVYLPLDADITIPTGKVTRAAETIIASL